MCSEPKISLELLIPCGYNREGQKERSNTMGEVKTKAIEAIEKKMGSMDESSVRYLVLKNVKLFKTSWIGLGQALYTVWKDKAFKEWGFTTFDAYTSREIGIRKQTALKLLRSYSFLEREEPQYLMKDYAEKADAATLPTCDSVNTLRLANNNKSIDKADYAAIKEKVLDKGRDARDIKKELTQLIKEREELEPEEAWKKKKLAIVKRFLGTLKSISREIKITKVLPAKIVSETDSLISELEDEIYKIGN
jgi:hypothetical protein